MSAELTEACRLYESQANQIPSTKLGEVLRICGANPSEAELAAKIGSKAAIDFGEVATILGSFSLGQHVSGELKNAFGIFDISGSGSADMSEVRQVLGNLGEKFDNTEVAELMRVVEVDGEGQFSYEELIKFCEQYRVAGSGEMAVSGGGGQLGGEDC